MQNLTDTLAVTVNQTITHVPVEEEAASKKDEATLR